MKQNHKSYMENTYFKWDKNFLTGNKEIDEEHFKLVNMINELLQASLNYDDYSLETILKAKKELAEYVVVHFTHEEELMEQFSVEPEFSDEHKKIHKKFVSKIDILFKNADKEMDDQKLSNISEYLVRWLAYHVLNTDKSLVRQLDNIRDNKMSPKDAFLNEAMVAESSTEPLLKALRVLYQLISQKNKEIELKNSELEKRVLERTKELEEANKKLKEMSISDDLTSLPNRRYVMDKMENLIYEWKRYKVPFSLLFIDIDNFKMVNDNYGHEAGNHLLMWIGEYLREHTRKTDTPCRLGGDEFVVVCAHTSLDEAKVIANKINQISILQPLADLELWQPSISIGVSTIDSSIVSASDLLKKADKAMYDAKSKGGGQVRYI